MATIKLKISERKIAQFCRKHGIRKLSFFGSVLREDFRPESDVDVLVELEPDARPTLFDMSRMQDELQLILGHRVDLVSRRGVESSRNVIRRKAILESARDVYAA